MFFVYISFAFGTQGEPNFRWNMGLSKTLNLNICSRDRGILREFGEILGKYSILDVKSVGSKRLSAQCAYKYLTQDHYDIYVIRNAL